MRNVSHRSHLRFLQEYEIINMLNHPNIVKAFGIFIDKKNPSFLLEFYPMNLKKAIINRNLSNIQIVFIIYQIIEGMKYLHFTKIIHRDLKPSNILIDSSGIAKISDFGLSKLLNDEDQSFSTGIGTLKFMAPEMLNESDHYDEKVDVYSFGVMLFFIISGYIPNIRIADLLKGEKAKIPPNFTNFSRDLINSCWNFDPKKRPSFGTMMEEMQRNNYNFINLTRNELNNVKSIIKKHKEHIPLY